MLSCIVQVASILFFPEFFCYYIKESILGHFVGCYSMTIVENIKAQMDIFSR